MANFEDAYASISIGANATASGQLIDLVGVATAMIQLTGTWTATAQVQITRDAALAAGSWTNITGSNVIVNAATGAYVASGNLTANGMYQVDISGAYGVRVITTAYTSGTITGTVAASSGAGIVSIEGQASFSPTAYPLGATAITSSSGNVANASGVATLAAAAGKTTYITGFEITGAGATAGAVVSVTVTGTVSGTLTYTYTSATGVAVANTPLQVEYPVAIPGNAVNTAIVVTCPAIGAGSTNNTVVAHGYQL